MEPLTAVLALLAALGLAASAWLLRERYRLQGERDVARARLSDEARLRESFQALSGEALRSANAELLRLARESLTTHRDQAVLDMDQRRTAVEGLLAPIQDALQRTRDELKQVGRDHSSLHAEVKNVALASQALRSETGKLAQALRKPNVRGRYGEIQLERVVELSGMRSYCDFVVQENLRDDEGRLQKPDLVVRLPNNRLIAIDAKTSIDSYLDAIDATTPEEAERLLDRYAQNVVDQAHKLARKHYWTRFDASPELVVMFIPGDQLVDAALERRPDLIEIAAQENVVIASPSTLIGLLRAVHVGWREKNLSDSAHELFELGRELHQRAAIVLERASKVGQAIDGARRHYNQLVGSVQNRLLPTLRKFEERDARSSRQLVDLAPIDGEARALPPLPAEEPAASMEARP